MRTLVNNETDSLVRIRKTSLRRMKHRPAGRRFSGARGFTLIEILVVMAVIALLLTIALPRYFGSIEKSKEVVLKENLQVLRTGLEKYYADKGQYPEALDDLVTQKYFKAVPVDPVTESSTTWILIPSSDVNEPGIENVKSGAQGKMRDGMLYEQL